MTYDDSPATPEELASAFLRELGARAVPTGRHTEIGWGVAGHFGPLIRRSPKTGVPRLDIGGLERAILTALTAPAGPDPAIGVSTPIPFEGDVYSTVQGAPVRDCLIQKPLTDQQFGLVSGALTDTLRRIQRTNPERLRSLPKPRYGVSTMGFAVGRIDADRTLIEINRPLLAPFWQALEIPTDPLAPAAEAITRLESEPSRVLHGDPHFGNLIALGFSTADRDLDGSGELTRVLVNPVIFGVIDWENAAVGPPSWEAAWHLHLERNSYTPDQAAQLRDRLLQATLGDEASVGHANQPSWQALNWTHSFVSDSIRFRDDALRGLDGLPPRSHVPPAAMTEAYQAMRGYWDLAPLSDEDAEQRILAAATATPGVHPQVHGLRPAAT